MEDIRLAYTYIRLDNGQRLIVPNEALAQSSVHNHTVVDPRVKVEIDVWLPPGGDATRALELLAADDGVEARIGGGRPRGHHADRGQLGRERARAGRSGGAPA